MVRVVLFGLGPIGAGIARLVASRSDLEIVGAIDVDPQKVGKDLGEVIGLDHEVGVSVSDNSKEVLKSAHPDVVVQATGSHLEQVAPQIREVLEAGSSLVSTCEELSFPYATNLALASELDHLAKQHGAVLLGTGVNPGFAMDTLPLSLTAVSQRVDSVRVLRVQDAAQRRLPLQRKVGAGLSSEEFDERVKAGTVRHVGLPESVYAIAAAIGWKVDSLDDHIEPVIATTETRSSEIVVAPGQVLGVKQVTKGLVGGQPLIELELQMYLGAPEPHDHVVVEGLPRVEVTVHEGTTGDLATAAIIVNAIGSVLRAESGLRVMADLPLVHYRRPEVGMPSRRSARHRRDFAF
jgi:4-hydroxy-tetrahydrodipicolinate reductase